MNSRRIPVEIYSCTQYIPAHDRIEIFDDPALSAETCTEFYHPSAAVMMKLIRILVYIPAQRMLVTTRQILVSPRHCVHGRCTTNAKFRANSTTSVVTGS
jgi:hypothetical protein